MAGSLVHFELPSEDAARATQFWSRRDDSVSA
jgi:predicted enzyme related to lactoylglutathione lyase